MKVDRERTLGVRGPRCPGRAAGRRLAVAAVAAAVTAGAGAAAEERMRDLFSDTWTATDALGRRLPSFDDVGPPRPDRTVGIFYFLWHGEHIVGGPWDVSRILARDPDAMDKKDSPLWGPLHAPHHWGESIFGYYLTDDEGVLRKHAQMLADLGVDVAIFDVTNQITYPRWYGALLRVWSEARSAGNRTPQVAFLCPFWSPKKVVEELWRDLYEPGLHRDLWFIWDGKPLILADPELVSDSSGQEDQDVPAELPAGRTLAQTFDATRPFRSAGGRFPTWATKDASVTLTLRREPGGEVVASRRFERFADNAWLLVPIPDPAPPGRYRLEASGAEGKVGWWSHTADRIPGGEALADGRPAGGDRTLRLVHADGPAARIRESFTFRKPQPDYFQGPVAPDMWSWLEVHPQHVFRNGRGEEEQMSVGVAQNAVGDRLGSMSEPGARGRSFHGGAFDPAPGAVLRGLNLAEQWEHALREDPRFVFVTGWNEWIAGRFDEFNGIRRPVLFVDQFDQEHSRDIEPMRGGHGDNYLWQLAAYVRRYKGVRRLGPIRPAPIAIDGRLDDWAEVGPEFLDTVGDPVRRDHRGWDPAVRYTDSTGRNDIVSAKVSFDETRVCFQAACREPLSPATDPRWMMLFVDADADATTGWLGFDRVINRQPPRDGRAVLERCIGPGYVWGDPTSVELGTAGSGLEIAVPRTALGIARLPATIDFQWADNVIEAEDWSDFTLHGDAAPNDRFRYRARLQAPVR